MKALLQRWARLYARKARHGEQVRGIYLHGEPGSGKTHLACAVANELIAEHGLFVRFVKVGDIPRNDQDALDELADGRELPLLVLDDLGAEKLTERMQEILFRILDGRMWTGGVTVITSNLDQDGIRNRFDESQGAFPGCGRRVAGRIRESCNMVLLSATDRREDF